MAPKLPHRFLRPARGVFLETILGDVLVSASHRRDVGALAGLEVAFGHRGHGHARLGPDDGLGHQRAVRIGVALFFLEEEHARGHEAGLRILHRGGIRGQEQRHLVLDRDGERIHLGVTPPGTPLIAGRGRQHYRLAARGAIGLGLSRRLPSHRDDAIGGQLAGCGKAPRSLNQNPDPDPEGLVVGKPSDPALPGEDVLSPVEAHPRVGVLRARRLGGIERAEQKLVDGRIARSTGGTSPVTRSAASARPVAASASPAAAAAPVVLKKSRRVVDTASLVIGCIGSSNDTFPLPRK